MKAVPIRIFMHLQQRRLRVHFLFYQPIKKAMESVGKDKPIPVQWLRHSSFGTSLLETGVDLDYIQSLFGRESSKTTVIYTHVSKNAIQNIQIRPDKLELRKNDVKLAKKQPKTYEVK